MQVFIIQVEDNINAALQGSEEGTDMNFKYNKAICQNLRESLRLEWLETNGLGDYASSSIVSCNTRRYHGLFVANLDRPAGRHVLLSALEESLLLGGHEFFFSCRQHPGNFFPKGHEYLREAEIGAWPLFRYRIGDAVLTREIVMPHGEHRVLIRYSLEGGAAQAKLRIKPLLAYRNFHALTHANMNLHVRTWPETAGFKVEPYDGMPPLFMQTDGRFTFLPSPDWYYNAEYLIERERGFPYAEDLFQPGLFEIELSPQRPVILSAALQPTGKAGRLARLWNDETRRRLSRGEDRSLTAHLEREGEKFLIDSPRNGKTVIAGYPWFDAWGRDTFIALPGLTFCAGRSQEGVDILAGAGGAIKDGLIPNCYGADGVHHSYNSADASLWYVWAVQQMAEQAANGLQLVKKLCWQPIKEIIAAYADGRAPHTHMDEAGLLHVGAPDTQLTWMDASVGGRPVTPRWGCPVEINALWYNALVFAGKTAAALGETPPWDKKRLAALKKEFAPTCFLPPHCPNRCSTGRWRRRCWPGCARCCSRRMDCARCRPPTSTTDRFTKVRRKNGIPPITRAPSGRGCWEPTAIPCSSLCGIGRRPPGICWGRSRRCAPPICASTASVQWPRSSTPRRLIVPTAPSPRPGAWRNCCAS